MIIPEVFIKSFKSYRSGDKGFCKLASISDKDGSKNYFGFWIDVIKNDPILVLSVQFKMLAGNEPAQLMFFSGREHVVAFMEDARQHATNELEKMLCPEQT